MTTQIVLLIYFWNGDFLEKLIYIELRAEKLFLGISIGKMSNELNIQPDAIIMYGSIINDFKLGASSSVLVTPGCKTSICKPIKHIKLFAKSNQILKVFIKLLTSIQQSKKGQNDERRWFSNILIHETSKWGSLKKVKVLKVLWFTNSSNLYQITIIAW